MGKSVSHEAWDPRLDFNYSYTGHQGRDGVSVNWALSRNFFTKECPSFLKLGLTAKVKCEIDGVLGLGQDGART